MFRRIALAASLAALTGTAVAQDNGLTGSAGVFFSLLSDSNVSDTGLSLDADGTAFGFRGDLGSDTVFGYVEYQDSSQDGTENGVNFDVDLTEKRVGLGVRSADPTLNFIGRLERYDADADLRGPGGTVSGDDDGAGVHLGVEAKTSDTATVFGSAGYLNLGNSAGPEFRAGIKALVQDQVEVFGEYRLMDLSGDTGYADLEVSDIRLGASFRF